MPELPIVIRDSEILGGTPVFRGTRVPFQALLDYLEGGETLDEFLLQFPTVNREMAIDALEYAKDVPRSCTAIGTGDTSEAGYLLSP